MMDINKKPYRKNPYRTSVLFCLLSSLCWIYSTCAQETSCGAVNRSTQLVKNDKSVLQSYVSYTTATATRSTPRTRLSSSTPYTVVFEYPGNCNLVARKISFASLGLCDLRVTRQQHNGEVWSSWTSVQFSHHQHNDRNGAKWYDELRIVLPIVRRTRIRFKIRNRNGCHTPLVGTEPFISLVCEDVNECTETPHPCNPYSGVDSGRCFNNYGSYSCVCHSSFTQAGGTCQDINECGNDEEICKREVNSYCHNSIGSFRCVCKSGFTGRPCQDINECMYEDQVCSGLRNSENRICHNTNGSYQCPCVEGKYDGNCSDIDECKTDKDVCTDVKNSYCANTKGSFECTCKRGFTGPPCQDVDECEQDKDICNGNARSYCQNTIGSYQCVCTDGYSGLSCEDINECTDEADVCSGEINNENRACSNTIGSYHCPCLAGNYDVNCSALVGVTSSTDVRTTATVAVSISTGLVVLILATLVTYIVIRKRQKAAAARGNQTQNDLPVDTVSASDQKPELHQNAPAVVYYQTVGANGPEENEYSVASAGATSHTRLDNAAEQRDSIYALATDGSVNAPEYSNPIESSQGRAINKATISSRNAAPPSNQDCGEDDLGFYALATESSESRGGTSEPRVSEISHGTQITSTTRATPEKPTPYANLISNWRTDLSNLPELAAAAPDVPIYEYTKLSHDSTTPQTQNLRYDELHVQDTQYAAVAPTRATRQT
ncbi:uncharacterized protein LOC135811605 isoform X2 [Sycon ciliatum]|uniref:uncharacterized protein LOC135811605 isoform X2 n=1 Tax=Sycon ciliatum TaxID=27933 RepID=UPI0031F5F753